MKLAATLVIALFLLPVFPLSTMASQNQDLTASTRTVTGTQIGHYKNGPLPNDLSAVQVAAYVPNGSGGYNMIPGSGTSGGTFSIPNVPTGYYLLQLGYLYLATNNTVVNADFNVDERSNGVLADSNTTVTFNLSNLHSWQSSDIFEMVCPNNGAFNEFDGTVGETTFVGTFPYYGNLSDGSQGDQNYILQLITLNVGGYPFTAAGRGFLPPKFTQQQGSNAPINGRLATIPQTRQFEANINGADLTAQAMAANPNATLNGTSIYLDAYQGSLVKGENTSSPDLVLFSSSAPPFITTNGDLGAVAYGNPFPPTWPLFDYYAWNTQTDYVAPGATNSTSIFGFTSGSNTTLPTSTNPIKPLIGVVSNPTINGKNFFAGQTGVGFTPTLRWSPPTVGTPTFYEVHIYQLQNNGGNSTRFIVAKIRTQGTSLTVPPGLLTSGLGYVFVIRAWYVPGLNFAQTPYMYGPIEATADRLSAMVQP